jgi:mono/diheme cytochrome c family protein
MRLPFTLAVAAAALAGCAFFQTEADRGQYVAAKWCSECHRISPDQPSGMRPGHVLTPSVGAPSFMDIAARPGADAQWLDHFLSDVHLPMPTYRLREDERRGVIAYILSLNPARQ